MSHRVQKGRAVLGHSSDSWSSPREPARMVDALAGARLRSVGIMTTTARGAAVLCVDESPGGASNLAAFCQEHAHTVIVETNFLQAERRLAASHFDVVVTAGGGVGAPGAAFIRRVRELPGYSYTPVVAATALPDNSPALWSAGASAVLIKPDAGLIYYLQLACYEASMRRREEREPEQGRPAHTPARLTKWIGWWSAIIILALSIAAAGAFNRYDVVVVSGAGVFRIDKFSGRVEVFPFVAGAKPPSWFSVAPAQ
jgi:CheY-like chemotaxis protein